MLEPSLRDIRLWARGGKQEFRQQAIRQERGYWNCCRAVQVGPPRTVSFACCSMPLPRLLHEYNERGKETTWRGAQQKTEESGCTALVRNRKETRNSSRERSRVSTTILFIMPLRLGIVLFLSEYLTIFFGSRHSLASRSRVGQYSEETDALSWEKTSIYFREFSLHYENIFRLVVEEETKRKKKTWVGQEPVQLFIFCVRVVLQKTPKDRLLKVKVAWIPRMEEILASTDE